MAKQQTEEFDLFNLDDSTASYLDNKKKSQDGLYRPSLEQLKNKKSGVYEAIIRFLPNLPREAKKFGSSAIEKHSHYAKFESHPELSGYYDCMKQFEQSCDLCTMYWKLAKSKDAEQQERAKLIGRSTKFYQYVLVVEDDNQPDLVGKILIFSYGVKIKDKIKDQKDHAKRPCRVEDLSHGRDFLLRIKEVAGYANYDSSEWDDVSPIRIFEDGEWITPKIDKATGKIAASESQRIMDFLYSRETELEDFAPKRWTEEQQEKVNKILQVLSGVVVDGGDLGTRNTRNTQTAADVFGSQDDASGFSAFDTEEEEVEEEVATTSKAKKSSFFEDFDDDL